MSRIKVEMPNLSDFEAKICLKWPDGSTREKSKVTSRGASYTVVGPMDEVLQLTLDI